MFYGRWFLYHCANVYSLFKERQGANDMQAIVTKQNVNLESIKGAISAKIGSAGFTAWIAPLQINICENCLNLVAQNQFTADYIRREYGNTLKDIAADFLLDLNISVRANNNVVKSAKCF